MALFVIAFLPEETNPWDSSDAKKYYGDASKYHRIFEANRDQLSDPDKIKVGQRLRIPT